ncbi:hypothetical protein BH11VER1_BH11VER1_17060 [soil metagenome]
MKLSTTILLFLLVGGLAFFIATKESSMLTTKEKLNLATRPFSYDPNEIDGVTITTKDQSIKLNKLSEGWQVESPYQDRGDAELVGKLLSEILALEWVETLKGTEMSKEDLKHTGLRGNATTVTLHSKNSEVARIKAGSKSAIENATYLSLPSQDEETIHIAKTELGTFLQKNPEAWRDAKLLRLKADTIHRLVLSAETGVIEFARQKDGSWMIVKPLQTRASDERVKSVLAALLNLEIKPYKNIDDKTTVPGVSESVMQIALEASGLDKPVEITLHAATQPGDEVIVDVSNRTGAFLAPAKVAELWKLQPNHLRDQRLARIPVERVAAIRLRSSAYPEIVIDRQADTWMLTRMGKTETANTERVQKLFDGLNSSQIRDFISDAPTSLDAFGLNQPFLEVEWRIDEKPVVLQFGQGLQGMVCAKYRDEPFIYRVNPMILSSLPIDGQKWRSKNVVNASLFSVHRIIIAEGDAPSMTLHYRPDDATWTANMAGRDVSDQLDKAHANTLLQKLANFEALDWSSDRRAAYEALKNPTLTLQLLLSESPAPGAKLRATTLLFAPTAPGMDTALYHGRVEGDPDTFIIDRDLYHELTSSVLKK